MIISIRLKNFFSIKEEAVLDFTADTAIRNISTGLNTNLMSFSGDKFVKTIGLFGSNAAGKSNIIKAIDFCRRLVLTSHLNNEGDEFDYEPFKFDSEQSSEFYINFVSEGVEYEYSFELFGGRVISEEFYHYPNKRKARIFTRKKTFSYTHGRSVIYRPTEVEANTGSKTLFLSRASSMGRQIAQSVYRFFLYDIVIGPDSFAISDLPPDLLRDNMPLILKTFEISDSDITDLRILEDNAGRTTLKSYHRENPTVAFDFDKEESEGTKRLLYIVLLLLKGSGRGTTFFIDEFDLKLHFLLTRFLLDIVNGTGNSQLVFTSHNPWLLDREILRSDQIVFVSKNRDGGSEFVPLSDYEGVTSKTDIRKAYMQGRFDAVPYIGDAKQVVSDFLRKHEDA